MTRPRTFQEQLDVLAHGEVQPLLLATDVERREDLLVHVVLVDPQDVEAGGHASTGPVFTRRFPLPPDGVGDEELRDARRETVVQFAARLRALLADG